MPKNVKRSFDFNLILQLKEKVVHLMTPRKGSSSADEPRKVKVCFTLIGFFIFGPILIRQIWDEYSSILAWKTASRTF